MDKNDKSYPAIGQTVQTFDVIQGIWNPRDNKYSWIRIGDGMTHQEASDFVDNLLLERAVRDNGLELSEITRMRGKKLQEIRNQYEGPPLRIMEVKSKVIEMIGGLEPPALFRDPTEKENV